MINTATVLRAFFIITLNLTLISCSGGGDSAPVNSTTSDPVISDPTISSNWDQMEWDKGTWSN